MTIKTFINRIVAVLSIVMGAGVIGAGLADDSSGGFAAFVFGLWLVASGAAVLYFEPSDV